MGVAIIKEVVPTDFIVVPTDFIVSLLIQKEEKLGK